MHRTHSTPHGNVRTTQFNTRVLPRGASAVVPAIGLTCLVLTGAHAGTRYGSKVPTAQFQYPTNAVLASMANGTY